MNQDMKIGLALAVLLLGIVGAFFFRNETDPTQPPPIEGTAELDAQIAEKEFVPYLTGVEMFDSTGAADHDPRGGAGSDRGSQPPAIDFDLPDFLTDDSEQSRRMTARPEPPPEPISTDRSQKALRLKVEPDRASGSAADVAARSRKLAQPQKAASHAHQETVRSHSKVAGSSVSTNASETPASTARNRQRDQVAPQHNNAWRIVDPPSAAAPADRTSRSLRTNEGRSAAVGAPRFRTHRVQKGETLSKLAQRYLGDSRRFLELYEANRHLLKDPDDLKVGMVIRIPEAGPDRQTPGAVDQPSARSRRRAKTSRQSSPSGRKASSTNQGDPAAPAERPTRRSLKDLFEPVPHTPLNPSRRLPSAASPSQKPLGLR